MEIDEANSFKPRLGALATSQIIEGLNEGKVRDFERPPYIQLPIFS